MQEEKEPSVIKASCRNIREFERGDIIGEGTYGIVYFSRDRSNGELLAIKKMKVLDTQNGFPITSLREVKILRRLSGHPNIVELREVVVGSQPENVYLVFEHCEIDLYKLLLQMSIDNVCLFEGEVKCLTLQLIKGVSFAHSQFVIHRDLKLTNLLLNKNGILKIADFGLAREFEEPYRALTRKVVTLWYRAPELLIKSRKYGQSVDAWSVGCILAELLRQGDPLFKGKSALHQFETICQFLAFPTKEEWPDFYAPDNRDFRKEVEKWSAYNKPKLHTLFPHVSERCLHLLLSLLRWDPQKRLPLEQAFTHPYFYQPPKPTFPDQIRVLTKLSYYAKQANEQLSKRKK